MGGPELNPRMHRSAEAAVLVAVGPDARRPRPHGTRAGPVLAQRQLDQLDAGLERGQAARRRVDDERGTPVVDDRGVLVDPVAVVAADVAADRQGLVPHLARRVGLGVGLGRRRLDLGDLLRRQDRTVLVRGPLQRRQRLEVPDPLQVGLAIGQPGRLVGLGAGRGRRHQERGHYRKASYSHLRLPSICTVRVKSLVLRADELLHAAAELRDEDLAVLGHRHPVPAVAAGQRGHRLAVEVAQRAARPQVPGPRS